MSQNPLRDTMIHASTRRPASSGTSAHRSGLLLSRPARGWALVVGVLVLLALVAIVLFFTVGGPFGTLNDLANVAVGLASAVLAALTLRPGRPAVDQVAALVGIVGGVVLAYGATLVLRDETGWFLAGIVSAVGAGLVGAWLLVLNRRRDGSGADRLGLSPVRGGRLGRWAGAVMALGLLGVPSWAAGIDDPADAPWHAWVATLGWLGTYVLYPAWCLRVRRAGDVGRARPPGRRPRPRSS